MIFAMRQHLRTSVIVGLLACATLTSCARFAEVRERHPIFKPGRTTEGALAAAERDITNSIKRSKSDPQAALAGYLTAAQVSAAELQRNPQNTVARDNYNFAIARVFSVIRDAKIDPWSKPLVVPAAGGDFVLSRRPDPRKAWNPALYRFTPADQFDVGGAYIKEHSTKAGIGAPLVAVGREMNIQSREEFSLPRIYYGVTAWIHFSGRHAEICIEDPLATENVSMGGRTFPLAADYTVPIAVMLASTKPEKMGLSRLLNPEKYADTARIARLQPYDPNKTVVLVVHGLNSSPATYTPLINSLRADEGIRRNYQFWFFSYPSGYPYPYSAAILRKELDAIEKRYPLERKMVVIGHSMGGCISRLLITDVGDKLWLDTFGKPPAEVQFSDEHKEMFKDALIFNHRSDVGRVIFVAAPLRGADMASAWTGRLGSRLVKAPFKLLSAGTAAMKMISFRDDDLKLDRIPNSVDTLAPNNRFVRNINKYPLTPGIPYNCIVGDRGKGGNKDKTKPCCSDGLVPYWSSYLPGAESELTVPSGHGAHQNPQAIAEIRRILLLHAGE
jgi:pimeloyl-ACP methyl ester carboxylesterase